MKNFALIVLSIATAVFASLYLRETSKSIQAQTTAESLQQQVGALQSTVDEQERESVKLRAEVKQVQTEAAAKARELMQLKASSTNLSQRATAAASSAKKTTEKPSNPLAALAKMFEDPEMKEALVAQQKAALGPMIDKTYGKLFSDLKLTPEQTTALKEMLVQKLSAGSQVGMSMLSEGSDPAKAAELGQKVKAASEAADAEIKAFLGEEKFAQLQAYEKASADRMAVSGFKDQLSGSAALTPEQEQQLVDVMTQARKDFKFTTDFSNGANLKGDFSMFNEENVNRFVQEMDQLNQHFVSHAQNILKPDQLEAFQKHLNNQQAMQKMGMQMGAKMFAPAKQDQ